MSTASASEPLSRPPLRRTSFNGSSTGHAKQTTDSEGSNHVRSVIREQFATEVSYKESELEQIEERIHLAKMMLQRLRLGVLAQHFGVAAFYPTALDYREETIGEQDTWELFEREFFARQEPDSIGDDSASQPEGSCNDISLEDGNELVKKMDDWEEKDSVSIVDGEMGGTFEGEKEGEGVPPQEGEDLPMETNLSHSPPPPPLQTTPTIQLNDHQVHNDGTCYREPHIYCRKRIIVGNTSQYLDPSSQQVTSENTTHKWMVYIRGPQTEPDISHFVKSVRFFLHPSYHPNDIVKVRSPPFHLTRLGWGEFPVRVQLEFVLKANKSVDIIHNLVLDRTHTGQQTLGCETVVDLDIVVPPEEGRLVRLNGFSSYTPLRASGSDMNDKKKAIHLQMDIESAQPQAPPIPVQSSDMENNSITQTTTDFTSISYFGPSSGSVFTTNLDKCLHNAVRGIPICGKPSIAEEFFIPAPTLTQYRLWNIGRRRATEWERAVAVRRSVERKLKVPSLLSTKKVMQWCRQNGYTPLDPVPANGRGFCKVCGSQLEARIEEEDESSEEGEDGNERMVTCKRSLEVHERCQTMMFGKGLALRGSLLDPFDQLWPDSMEANDNDPPLPKLCSLTQPHDIVARMLSQQSRLEEEARKLEEDVDIYSCPSSPSCARSRALGEMVPRFRVPQTPELKWVQQTASSIGIHIYPAVIDRMYAHVVEHMMYISCARFLRGILGQAVQKAGQQAVEGRLSQDRVLTPFHLQQAILKLEHCDFLTNKHIGIKPIPVPAEEQLITAIGSNSSCSSSSSSCSSSSDEEEIPRQL